jgi:uncharacterized protein YheU (UPF0270 family)
MTNNHQLPKGKDIVVWGPKHNCMDPHDKMEWTLGYLAVETR